MVGGVNIDADAGWNPLILSTIAGMSTCLGALIVFCHPVEEETVGGDEESAQLTAGNGAGHDSSSMNNQQRSFNATSKGRRKVSPSTMAFSLALAGSVMITVSIVSIGPECLAASSMPQNALLDIEENSFFIFGITLMPINSWPFLHRLMSFGLGCFLYYFMSKYAFPEPEEILSTHSETLLNRTGVQVQRSFSDSSKYSDDEEGVHQSTKKQSSNDTGGKSESTASLMRRGGSSLEGNIEMGTLLKERSTKDETSPGKSKASIFRESTTEQKSWISYLRSFTTGSDLQTAEARRANRVAMLLFFSLLIHNFPEGLAVAASALESDQLGLTVTVGIMIHNIPEGIAIAIPCLKARPDSPWLSFVLASVSGLAEPAGAFLSLVILRSSNGQVFGGEGSLENVLAFVAGIMITVSILELLPEAKRHATANSVGMKAYYSGIVVGFVVMWATELGMSI
jgi:ZIP family zinc transporter